MLYLEGVTSYAYNRYIGSDLQGNFLVATIENGTVKTANLNDYSTSTSIFFVTKKDEENVVTFYSCDDTLTKINYSYDADDYTFDTFDDYNDVLYYMVTDKVTGNISLVYFK